MLPVKVVRSLVLGETMNNPFHHHHRHDQNDNTHDADDEYELDNHHHHHHHRHEKKIPLLLFVPTKELISDTFRLASIARDIGMDFHPSPSLSHLIFSWPSSSSSSSSSSPSSTTTTSSSSSSKSFLSNDEVPLPFPSLSTPTVSLSLLRYFVSLSKGLFKLVFFHPGPGPRPGFGGDWAGVDCPKMALFSRVSARRVGSMDDLSRALAGHGWALFRAHQPASPDDLVYVFQKKDWNRVRASGGSGECRIRELRLPALDFGDGVPLRVLLYILLMTDDVFYFA